MQGTGFLVRVLCVVCIGVLITSGIPLDALGCLPKKKVFDVSKGTVILDHEVNEYDEVIVRDGGVLTLNGSILYIKEDLKVRNMGKLLLRNSSVISVKDEMRVSNRGVVTLNASMLDVESRVEIENQGILDAGESMLMFSDDVDVENRASVTIQKGSVTVNRSVGVENHGGLGISGSDVKILGKVEIENHGEVNISSSRTEVSGGGEIKNHGKMSIFFTELTWRGKLEIENKGGFTLDSSEAKWNGSMELKHNSNEFILNTTAYINGKINAGEGSFISLMKSEIYFTGDHDGIYVLKGAMLEMERSILDHRTVFFDFVIYGGTRIEHSAVYNTRGSIAIYSDGVTIAGSYIAEAERTGIHIYDSSPSIVNSTITENGIGILVEGGSPLITGNTISNNDIGILVEDESTPSIIDNSFEHNLKAMTISADASVTMAGNDVIDGDGGVEYPVNKDYIVPAGETRVLESMVMNVSGNVEVYGRIILNRTRIKVEPFITREFVVHPGGGIFAYNGSEINGGVRPIRLEGEGEIIGCKILWAENAISREVIIRSSGVTLRQNKIYGGVRVYDAHPLIMDNEIIGGGIFWDDSTYIPRRGGTNSGEGTNIDLNVYFCGDGCRGYPWFVRAPGYYAEYGLKGETRINARGKELILQPEGIWTGGNSVSMDYSRWRVDGVTITHEDVISGVDYTKVSGLQGVSDFWVLKTKPASVNNLRLRYELIFSDGIRVYVEGKELGGEPITGSEIRLVSRDGYAFRIPGVKIRDSSIMSNGSAWLNSGEEISVSMRGVPQGGHIYLDVDVPAGFLERGVYPIIVDPEVILEYDNDLEGTPGGEGVFPEGGSEVTYVSGDWYASGNPYNIWSPIYVSGKLTIHPGVKIYSGVVGYSETLAINVGSGAKLYMNGTEDDPIFFYGRLRPSTPEDPYDLHDNLGNGIGFQGGYGEINYVNFVDPAYVLMMFSGSRVILRNSTVTHPFRGTGTINPSGNSILYMEHVEVFNASAGLTNFWTRSPPEEITVKRSTFTGNRAGVHTGVVNLSGYSGSITECNIYNNTWSGVDQGILLHPYNYASGWGYWHEINGNYITGVVEGSTPWGRVRVTNPLPRGDPYAGVWHGPDPPVLTGPEEVIVGVPYRFNITGTHPKMSPLKYRIGYIDGVMATAEGDPGETIQVTLTFWSPGEYYMAYTSEDIYGVVAWGEPVMIRAVMPNESPVAVARATQESAFTFEDIEFNGTGSYDPDGYIVNYTWRYEKGILGYGEVIKSSFEDDGVYTVTLIVEDNRGERSSSDVTVRILNRAPVPDLGDDILAQTGEYFVIDAGRSYDLDGRIVEYRWWISPPLDDLRITGEPYLTYRIGSPGFYFVNLTVVDDDGAVSSVDDWVRIVVYDPGWAYISGNVIRGCPPGGKGIEVVNEDLAIIETYVVSCDVGVSVTNSDVLFAFGQVANASMPFEMKTGGYILLHGSEYNEILADPYPGGDSDGDGIPDDDELIRGSNPYMNDKTKCIDRDKDGVCDHLEIGGGSGRGSGGGKVSDPDTDRDGLTDGEETGNGNVMWYEAESFLAAGAIRVAAGQTHVTTKSYVSPDTDNPGGYAGGYARSRGSSPEIVSIPNPFPGRDQSTWYKIIVRARSPTGNNLTGGGMMQVRVEANGAPVNNLPSTFFFVDTNFEWHVSYVQIPEGISTSKITVKNHPEASLWDVEVDTVAVVPLEYRGWFTNPRARDTDFDGVDDKDEITPGVIILEGEDMVSTNPTEYRGVSSDWMASMGAAAMSSGQGREPQGIYVAELPRDIPTGRYTLYLKSRSGYGNSREIKVYIVRLLSGRWS